MPSGAEFTRDERQLNQHENPNDAMSDDNSHSSDTVNSKKGFFSLLLSQLFHGEPKNRDELLALIRDSGQNDLIDEDTRDMLEGVMDIADQRVRDIMIPRSQMITLKRNQTLDECLDVIIESAHSRFPVISEDKDHLSLIHISEPTRLGMISYAVFCLKKKNLVYRLLLEKKKHLTCTVRTE